MTKIKEMYYDATLIKNLEILKKNIKKDWDFWLVIDGREGSGKSTLAQQVAHFLDDNGLGIDNIVFTPEQFKKAVMTLPKYSAIVWDEAVTGTQSIDMTKMARTLKQMAVQCRQKNLFVILVLHSYFDMKKYYAVHRTWFLLHVYFNPDKETGNIMRGFFEFYNYRKKKYMYLNDKDRRFYSYGQKPDFRGRFTKKYAVDEADYKEKKSYISEEDERIDEKEWVEEALRREIPVQELKKYCSYSHVWLYNIKKRLEGDV
jgi:hypothetical protein